MPDCDIDEASVVPGEPIVADDPFEPDEPFIGGEPVVPDESFIGGDCVVPVDPGARRVLLRFCDPVVPDEPVVDCVPVASGLPICVPSVPLGVDVVEGSVGAGLSIEPVEDPVEEPVDGAVVVVCAKAALLSRTTAAKAYVFMTLTPLAVPGGAPLHG